MKSLCLILFLALSATPACSRFTARARQDRAYTKYVRKSKIERERRQARLHNEKAKMPRPDTVEPSEPLETTQTQEGPQAVPSDQDNQ